jgi:molybdopterin converting factor small subunit
MRSIYKKKEISLEFDGDTVSLKSIIERLLDLDETGERAVRQVLVDSINRPWIIDATSINPAMVIMINDVDAKLRGGIDAELVDGDAITFLPTIHGG